jgi:uncharacterized protein
MTAMNTNSKHTIQTPMNIHKDITIIDLGIFVKKHNLLVFADFHLGYEESLNKKGVMVPRHQYKDTILRLHKILEKVSPETIIINGDLKHEFGRINTQEWRDSLRVIDLLSQHCTTLIIIQGNHDPSLRPIANKKNITVVKEYRREGLLVVHGDSIPKKLEDIIIIGHEHPAITLREERRKEKFKCYLKGKYKGKILLVQPSFNVLLEGTDVLQENYLSPFLKKINVLNFECWIVDKKILYFGRLNKI